jgi:hypothetical protein
MRPMTTSRTQSLPNAAVWMLAAALLSPAAQLALAQEPAAPPPPASAPAPQGAAPAPPGAPAGEPASGAPVHQRTGKISGTVTDTTRRILSGLLVKLESHVDPGMLRVTCTDLKGQYHFKDLPPGLYDVHVEADGFGPGSKEQIDVRPPFQNIVDVALVHAAPGSAAASAPGAPVAPGGPAASAPAGSGSAEAGEAAVAPVSVRGRFVDTGGRPALEVSVLMAGADGGRLYQTFSADDGTFLIEHVAPGRYRMLVRSTGHVTIDLKSVDVLPVDGLKLSLALVDFPLNTRPHSSRPQELPRPLPSLVVVPPGEIPAAPAATPGDPAAPPVDPAAPPVDPAATPGDSAVPPGDSPPVEEGTPGS